MDPPVRRCSFCGKPQGEVRLVAGPSEVYICHLCVALCSEILAQGAPTGRATDAGTPPPAGRVRVTRTELSSSAKAAQPETAGS